MPHSGTGQPRHTCIERSAVFRRWSSVFRMNLTEKMFGIGNTIYWYLTCWAFNVFNSIKYCHRIYILSIFFIKTILFMLLTWVFNLLSAKACLAGIVHLDKVINIIDYPHTDNYRVRPNAIYGIVSFIAFVMVIIEKQ